MQSCVCPHQTITKKQKTKPAHHLFQNISNNTLFKYKLKDLFFILTYKYSLYRSMTYHAWPIDLRYVIQIENNVIRLL